jgi:hypothetical protein
MKAWLLLALTSIATAQDFTQRGFLDLSGIGYPQTAPNDSGRVVGEALFRYEAFSKPVPGLNFAFGFDADADTHEQVERRLHVSLLEREQRRPALALRRLSVAYSRGKLTLEAGKQFIRWGRTDIVTPTDRFAPQDYLHVFGSELLSIAAARMTYRTQTNSVDLVYSPRLTPSRIPLVDQRWAVLPQEVSVRELPPDIPNGPQWGARFSHTGTIEYALTAYQGYDYFPLFHIQLEPLGSVVDAQPFYPSLRMYGGDLAIPLSPFTFKGEAAYFTSSNPQSDKYILYVAQLERQAGEWLFVGGYAGQNVTEQRSNFGFSEIRGFTKAIIGRAAYNIDVNRSFSFQAAVRQNGQGVLLNPEYTQAIGQHWRATFGFTWIHGSDSDFIGQYHRNSFAILRIRYSF